MDYVESVEGFVYWRHCVFFGCACDDEMLGRVVADVWRFELELELWWGGGQGPVPVQE